MKEFSTYHKIAGRVLKSSKLLKGMGEQTAAEQLQDILEAQNLGDLSDGLLSVIDKDEKLELSAFYENFTQIILRLVSESEPDDSFVIKNEELLEILRISTEEQLYKLQSTDH